MKKGDQIQLPFALLSILKDKTDSFHRLSMPDIQGELSLLGIDADRRTIYKAIYLLNDYGYPIHFVKENHIQGYYYEHPFTTAEAFILATTLEDSITLDSSTTKSLQEKILLEVSDHERKEIEKMLPKKGKTSRNDVLDNIEKIFLALRKQVPINFYYFDYALNKEKKYRKNKERYTLYPYGIVSNRGKFYVVLYSPKHEQFGNYRLDKMENIQLDEEPFERVPFNLNRHIQSSFDMYTGSSSTITVDFGIELADAVFEQFGNSIIVSKVSDTSFRANIPTALSPTLMSWLLLYYEQCTIIKPKELIDEFHDLYNHLKKTYHF